MIYEWKPMAGMELNAQNVGERLEKLTEENDGILTPQIIVNDARPVDSELHPAFEWNDNVAAEKYREDQARYLVRQIVVVSEEVDNKQPIRAFVSVAKEDAGNVYIPIQVAMENSQTREQVLRKAWLELQSWHNRYYDLMEFSKLFSAIETVKEDIKIAECK